MTKRWYSDGLQFTCTQCGRCCTGEPGYVWVTKAEVAALAAHLKMDLHAFGRRYLRRIGRRYSLVEKSNNDCVFYDGGCTVYSVRPKQCRTYPFWPENLRSRTAWEEVAQECPGAGAGQLYPVEEIRRIVRGDSAASS